MTRSISALSLIASTAVTAALLAPPAGAEGSGDADPQGSSNAIAERIPPVQDHLPALNDAAKKRGLNRDLGATMGWKTGPVDGGPARKGMTPAVAEETVSGIDVSAYQPDVNWADQWNAGHRFAFIKATEGTTWTSDTFSSQYTGSYDQGFVRGAYHFAHPDLSSGAEQAKFFVEHGGGWSGDGKTLPGVLDIEFNPAEGEDTCFGLTADEMVSWVGDFASTYKELTGRDPIIYTNGGWWDQCTNSSGAFAETSPLWQAAYTQEPPAPAGGWGYWTFWQYTDTPLDTNVFNGNQERLTALATG